MTKITLSVCKAYKNSGRFRFHRKKTKPAWKHYFIDSDDETFGTEWVSAIKAMILKRNVYKVRKSYCFECGLIFDAVIKKESDTPVCPNCG